MTLTASPTSPRPTPTDDTSTTAVVPAENSSSRNPWFDVLLTVALLVIITYNYFGWPLLANTIPAMGLMFAMAGSLMARSLTRQKGQHYRVIGRRLRRLLLPFWVLGLLTVPLMLWYGWTATSAQPSARWSTLWLWILPVSTPPGNDWGTGWGTDWTVPLWFIRTYVWFVVLSPPTLWLWRRWPRRVYSVAPLFLVLMISGTLKVAAPAGDVLLDLAIFGACWLLGYAHNDGHLQAMPWSQVLPLGSALAAGGLIWAGMHPSITGSWDVNEIPIAQAMFSVGGVLLLLRLSPRPERFLRHRALVGLATWVSSRALTIYLWNSVAIGAALAAVYAWPGILPGAAGGAFGDFLTFTGACLLLALITMALGWVEDVAAKRQPRILPRLVRPVGTTPVSAAAAPEGTCPTPNTTNEAARPARTLVLPRPRTVLYSIVAVAGYAIATWGVHWPGATAAQKGVVQLAIPPIRSSQPPIHSSQPQVSAPEYDPDVPRSPEPANAAAAPARITPATPASGKPATSAPTRAAAPAPNATAEPVAVAPSPNPTTATPTTPNPTTATPTTANPTSAKSTSANSTSARSTSANSTSARSTSANSTSARSTSANSTSARSTSANSTSAKSTSANPTSAKSTSANSTSAKS